MLRRIVTVMVPLQRSPVTVYRTPCCSGQAAVQCVRYRMGKRKMQERHVSW